MSEVHVWDEGLFTPGLPFPFSGTVYLRTLTVFIALIPVIVNLDQAPHSTDGCTNSYADDALCDMWAKNGQCDVTRWMTTNCQRSCRICYTEVDDNVKFERLIKEFYDYRSREFPEYATFVGYHDYDDALESFKLGAFDRRKNETQVFLQQVKSLDPEQLSRSNGRERRILMSYLQTFLDGYKWREYGALNTINFLEGLAKGPQWPMYARLETEHDFQQYLKRLASVPNQIYEQIALMKRAIKLKRSSHMVSVDRVPSMLREWDVNRFYFSPFQSSLANTGFSTHLKLRMWEKAQSLIPHVNQAINRLKKFIDKDYFDSTRALPGVHSLPQGLQYYEACLKWHLGYDAKAEEVFDLGVREVDRIEQKIKEVMRSVGFDGDLKSFFKYIEHIPKFYNHSKEQILQRYRSLLDDDIIPKMDSVFYNVSISPVTVVPVERDGPWGSYGLGTFYVNLKEPHKRSTFTMLPLTLHEAYPGHHFQDLYSQHWDIPLYRAQPMNGRMYSVPFQFPVYSAYAEGWALYSEYLGHELGLFEEPYDLFGRYVSEIFRACRLVVDTGIHAFGWTRERAIDFMSGYSDFPLSQVTSEVDRYITAPGQACSYKVGEIKIKHMREKAEKALGPKFNIKEFHHQILRGGYVPLDILQEIVDEWVESELGVSGEETTESAGDWTNARGGQPSQGSPCSFYTVLLCVITWMLYNKMDGQT